MTLAISPDQYVQRSKAAIIAREERSLEDPQYSLSENPEALLKLLGMAEASNALPMVSIEAALCVPAVLSAVTFLSRTMASLSIHTFEDRANGERIDDDQARLLSRAPNEEETSFNWRRGHWQDVFTAGRGLNWIERAGERPVAIWPMEPGRTEVIRRNGARIYRYENREYASRDVIDTPFMPKRDRLGAHGPIALGNKAISLAIAMEGFAGGFFAGGGVPPLALQGPLPSGREAFQRAQNDINRALDLARRAQDKFFPLPPGHELKPVGLEPGKGQMVEARLFQIQEIARIWQLPPVFVQDLSKGTFSNTEQQDLQLVKHLITHWANQFEQELTIKLYGWRSGERRVLHNLDALQRGDFKSRIEALARGIMTGQLMPDEARALENRPPAEGGDRLYIQQATVPLADAGIGHNGGPPLNNNDQDGDTDGNTEPED